MTALTPPQAEQLIALRTSLDDALRRAHKASKYRRGNAIVGLDACVERASALVSTFRGLSNPKNNQLDGFISNLTEALGPRWRPDVLPDIRQLRRARNAAQHEGLEPDREQIPRWASVADSYVSSLIEAQFGVDIHRVVRSYAVADTELRARIQDAESALNQEQYGFCVQHAAVAYKQALRRWKDLRRGGQPRRSGPRTSEVVDRQSHSYMKNEIDELRTTWNSLVFARDTAEIEWFRLAIEEPGDVLDADDAERALGFAFDWIVAFEQAVDVWTPDRKNRADKKARLVRSENVASHIDGCLKVDLHLGRVRAEFRIANVPEEEFYYQWVEALQDCLPINDVECGYWWSVTESGTVKVEKDPALNADFSAEVDLLSAALKSAHLNFDESLRLKSAESRAEERRRHDFASRVEAVRPELPHWVVDVEWSPDGVGHHDEMLVTVSDVVKNLSFGDAQARNLYGGHAGIMGLIRDHGTVTVCYFHGNSSAFGVVPVLTGPALKTLFNDVDSIVSKQLKIEERERLKALQATNKAKSSIAAKLATADN